jgi:hypothetical protein
MDPDYGSIFQNLYSAQSGTGSVGEFRAAVAPDLARDSAVIRRTIDELEAELKETTAKTLRSDAKYFLSLNLLQMVFIPLRLHGGPLPAGEGLAGSRSIPEGSTFADLISFLRDDLRLILNDAARRQEGREKLQYSSAPQDREISSHLVMEAIVANWSQLGLNSFRIWGEK